MVHKCFSELVRVMGMIGGILMMEVVSMERVNLRGMNLED